jgi:hypothetical protein
MNTAERETAYQAALNGDGASDIEDAIAQVCATLPGHMEERAGALWEGALLAEAQPWQLAELVGRQDWPALAALANISESGDRPWSKAARLSRERFASWRQPAETVPEQ